MDSNHTTEAVQVVSDPTWKQLAVVSLSAFFGSFLRDQRWIDAGGRLIWWKPLMDIPGSVAFGVMSYGFGTWLWQDKVSLVIVSGISGFMGMVGPGIVQAIAGKWLGVKDGN